VLCGQSRRVSMWKEVDMSGRSSSLAKFTTVGPTLVTRTSFSIVPSMSASARCEVTWKLATISRPIVLNWRNRTARIEAPYWLPPRLMLSLRIHPSPRRPSPLQPMPGARQAVHSSRLRLKTPDMLRRERFPRQL
jgi:hypothetical protein